MESIRFDTWMHWRTAVAASNLQPWLIITLDNEQDGLIQAVDTVHHYITLLAVIKIDS